MSPDRARALLSAPMGPLYHMTQAELDWVAEQLPGSFSPERTFYDLLREVAASTTRKLKKAA